MRQVYGSKISVESSKFECLFLTFTWFHVTAQDANNQRCEVVVKYLLAFYFTSCNSRAVLPNRQGTGESPLPHGYRPREHLHPGRSAADTRHRVYSPPRHYRHRLFRPHRAVGLSRHHHGALSIARHLTKCRHAQRRSVVGCT